MAVLLSASQLIPEKYQAAHTAKAQHPRPSDGTQTLEQYRLVSACRAWDRPCHADPNRQSRWVQSKGLPGGFAQGSWTGYAMHPYRAEKWPYCRKDSAPSGTDHQALESWRYEKNSFHLAPTQAPGR